VIRLLLQSFAAVVTVRMKLLWDSQSWLQPPFRRLSPARTSSHTPSEIAWAVAAVSSYVPNATCLVQALAAESLLARAGYPSRLHLGVARAEPPGRRTLDAHAWLECGGHVLLGDAVAHRYQTLFTRDGAVK
jgi:hypothetical protein